MYVCILLTAVLIDLKKVHKSLVWVELQEFSACCQQDIKN